jgi:hypothetical protein
MTRSVHGQFGGPTHDFKGLRNACGGLSQSAS